jgi:hypothetical protein
LEGSGETERERAAGGRGAVLVGNWALRLEKILLIHCESTGNDEIP